MGTKRSTDGGQHSFAQIPSVNMQRSQFDRSYGLKTTFDGGLLIPIHVDEALPGDTVNLQLTTFCRLATPLHPIMDNIYIETQFFAVPIRLVWENWQRMNGEQDDPDDSTDFLVPLTNSEPTTGDLVGSLSDYMGIPTEQDGLVFSALWHRAYNLIWNQFYRDENLQDSLPVSKLDAADVPNTFGNAGFPMRRGKRHDYFTSCLPFPQKGDAVLLPLGTTAPVVGKSGTNMEPTFDMDGNPGKLQAEADPSKNIRYDITEITSAGLLSWVDPKLEADLTNATAATINQIREAFQIQRIFERDARGGTRYTEIIQSHFGVTSPDQRLQRPEYLGGGSAPMSINTVPQTSNAQGETPQGNLAGYGISSSSNQGFNKSFTEHCVILGFISARADLNYQQGLERMWSRRTRFDFYWPAFAHLGEQAVLNKEIYAQGTAGGADDDLVWGYQERYAEYRYKPSKITGLMRSTVTGSLDTWHLAQEFTSLPVLGDTFIQDTPPIDRVIAVPAEPHFILDCFFKMKTARPMPMFGVPGNIDRF